MSINQGILYIVATPIGNLSDISGRAIEILQKVDLIAAEDTRHSKPLLQHYGVGVPMQAYHEHNEEYLTPKLIERLLAGESVALISDAGTPLLSDPGYRLVKAAHESSVKVSPVPGPCAAIAALSAAGLATDRFLFVGFSPHKQGARQNFYREFERQTATLVFYESSHRIVAAARDLLQVFGHDRHLVMAREMTKTFETIHSTTLGEFPDWLEEDHNQQKGEFVLVLEGAVKNDSALELGMEDTLRILLEELPVKQASQLTAKITGMKKNQVYKLALEITSK